LLCCVASSPPEPPPSVQAFQRNEARRSELGITPRELEILEAMAAGLSNREIAERLFVSENTVKTHAARVFSKLSARRRTQAIQIAKDAGLMYQTHILEKARQEGQKLGMYSRSEKTVRRQAS
jgi:DNA-binding NarL/FixJ family response regulator